MTIEETDQDVDLVDDEIDGPDVELDPDGDLVLDDDVVVEGPEDDFDESALEDEEDELEALPTFDDEADAGDDDLLDVDDELDEDREAVKEGEFVCRSCFLVKTASQLADATNQYCRDCA